MLVEDPNHTDFCRVCRCEATSSRPLFYPCMCTGSIKYIHQDCLLQWLQYSKRHTCELCNHPFKFAPIYASGTPRFLPPRVLFTGLVRNLRRTIVRWLHFCLVFVAWLVVVPLTACRIYRCLFTGSVSSLLTLPLDMVSTRHLLQDCLQGFTIVILALAAFVGYISLREQLIQGGIPAWLGRNMAGNAADGAEDNGQPFFPDLFNLFGVVNAVGNGEPVPENNANNAEIDNARPADSSADQQTSVDEPSTSSAAGPSTSSNLDCLSLERQQYGWRSDASNGQTNYSPNQAETEEPHEDNAAEDDAAAAAAAAAVGEAMNWDRLLGLDGSFAFLEHVLWLIALNTLFIVVFAFCPYHLGQFAVLGFNLDWMVTWTHMDGLATTLIGYVIASGSLVLFHYGFKYFAMPRASYWFGLGYVYIKVALVSLLEVGIFPILCGFWIDACTLSMFNATLPARVAAFHFAPMTFTFIHWAVGMLYIFYMASFLILARGVVRPGVLRFVYHFNDPDYKPVHDMIAQPLAVYTQRLIATFSIWGILIVFMLWIPVELVRRLLPGFLPFKLSVSHESPFDYSVEIILVQVILPFLLDMQARTAVRQLLRLWCVAVGSLLGIRSYLMGDVTFKQGDTIINEDGSAMPFTSPTQNDTPNQTNAVNSSHAPTSTINLQPLEAGDQHLPNPPPMNAHPDDPDGVHRYVPYVRPRLFTIRMLGFGVLILASLIVVSVNLIVVPVGLGRLVFHTLSSRTSPKHDAVAIVTGVTLLGVLLRLACCLPLLINAVRAIISMVSSRLNRQFRRPFRVLRIWTRSGTTCEIPIPRPALPAPSLRTNQTVSAESHAILVQLRSGLTQCLNLIRLSGAVFVFLVVLPIGLGLWINLTFIVPLQVNANKTLIIGFWEYWIFGIMHLKVAVLLTLAGPPWWFRRRLEAIQHEVLQHGHRARSLLLLAQLAPLLAAVGLSLSVPYLLAYYGCVWLGIPWQYAFRYTYPGLFAASILLILVGFQVQQLKSLYRRIKDENYLIGRRLVNFMSASTVISQQ